MKASYKRLKKLLVIMFFVRLAFYVLAKCPASLLDYLHNTPACPNPRTAPQHQEVCARIKSNPALVSLESSVELFEERPFVNNLGQIVMQPDLIAVQNDKYTVIEVGRPKNTKKQLNRVFHVLALNFNITPALIGVLYTKNAIKYHHKDPLEMRQLPTDSEDVVRTEITIVDIPYGQQPWPRMTKLPKY